MERQFWLERWQANEIGFHSADFNPWLVHHWTSVGVADGAGVFVPLCGKSLDIRWLNARGHPVVGVELSPVAVAAYFSESFETPTIEVDTSSSLIRHRGAATTIYCGDVFELSTGHLLDIRGVYDRAALVALPPELRARYVDHVLRIVPLGTRLLLVTVEYDQSLRTGPPFSVESAEVERLYSRRCRIQPLARKEMNQVPPQFKASGITRPMEAGYLLVKER